MEEIYIVMDCENCGETIRHLIACSTRGGIPEVPWDVASQDVFECLKCESTYITGDFETYSE